MSKTENAITWMENTARDNRHGYDQVKRWGQNGDYDCSAAVITAWEQAGVSVKKNGATYTGNIKDAFIKSGFMDVTASVNFSNGEGLKRGDILLKPYNHVAMYCGDGKEVEASINENGTTKGGVPGDQTGREFLIRSYRNYPWEYVLRLPEEASGQLTVEQAARNVIAGKYGNGDERMHNIAALGLDYNAVQAMVNEILNNKTASQSKNVDQVAREVIAGKWGNGAERKQRLKAAGYDPCVVQKKVNDLI